MSGMENVVDQVASLSVSEGVDGASPLVRPGQEGGGGLIGSNPVTPTKEGSSPSPSPQRQDPPANLPALPSSSIPVNLTKSPNGSPIAHRDFALASIPSVASPVQPGRPGVGGGAVGAGGVRKVGSGIAPGGLQMGTKIPPSLAAKIGALTQKSSNNSHSSNSSSHLLPGQRIDPSKFRLADISPSPSPSSSGSSSPLPGPSSSPRLGGPLGRVGPGGPIAGGGPGPMGGMKKRKPPGLSLNQLHGGDGPGAESSNSPFGGNGSGGDAGRGMGSSSGGLMPPGMRAGGGQRSPEAGGTPFSNFRKIVDPSGRLNFSGKAVLHAKGVDFSNGSSFAINMEQLTLLEELGRGNYGTVQKVFHKPTNVTMAMKEIRLELDDSKLKAIITELDVLHRAVSPEIIEFYGAFFIESCVYYCMEYMDAGSLDTLAGCDVPEDVLSRVTATMVRGLRFLKDELQTMHRDVKPTNVLVNRKGEVKLCDFGVSGQLERSLAKTNIGCQSYMAPERIKGESVGNVSTYTVSSDVWSLGLSIIEFAIGHYPYPPETYSNVFAQLQAIVHGDPPALPDMYSDDARDFVEKCLHKIPEKRPTYAELLEHPFLKADQSRDVDMAGWVARALEHRAQATAAIVAANAPAVARPNEDAILS